MAKGKINLQAADGAVIGLVVPDGLASGERQISLGSNLSGITAYHLLQGNLAVSNSTITQGFNTTLYTGNGSTQSINTGIDMSTQWGNDASETFGGLVWGKSRSVATNNYFVDTVRGVTKDIYSNATTAETTEATGLTAFSSTGFTLGSLAGLNTNLATYASWNFQTTHRRTGVTNHGKTYTEHYNPFTGFTIIKYEGSGIAGHEIPHSLGRKLGFVTVKNLSAATNWFATYQGNESNALYLNLTNANAALATGITSNIDEKIIISTDGTVNTSTNQYIMYGWANSYYDSKNTLIGNYEVVTYQGTGVAGNKVTTKGKPAWVMLKRTDVADGWLIYDNQRGDNYLSPGTSAVDGLYDALDFNSDGFTLKQTTTSTNTSGGQYIALVAYDTNSNGGGSYYPLASDTANVQINNGIIPLAHGIDSNGSKNSIVVANETITGVTYTEGKNYLYRHDTGYGVKNIKPNYGKINLADGGDFYNILENKWYTSSGLEITNSRNYLNHIVYADNDGGVLYVEELPKIEYKNVIKADEYLGKNACTAWVNFDGTTTPPKINDSYNVSAVIRVSTGVYDVYFKENMNTKLYSKVITGDVGNAIFTASHISNYPNLLNKCTVRSYNGSLASTNGILDVVIIGGKN